MAYTTIDKPSDFFNTIIWSGDSSSPENLTVGFQPDLIWGKLRNTGYAHQWYDSVRTFGNDKDLQSSSTAAEGGGTADQYGYISGVTSTGFTATKGSDGGADGYGYWNESGRTYVAWNWKAGTSFTNDASSTGIGTIDSTGSASDTAGFSIVSYTGTGSAGTIKHGLSAAPSTIILKNRIAGDIYWYVYHKSLGNNTELYLNGTDAAPSSTGAWNTTSPTSSVFSVGSHGGTNASGQATIAYCFAEKKGYSKFGSYTGNNNADGTFVFTGMKPSLVIVKCSSDTGNWVMFDNKRDGYNQQNNHVFSNTNGAEVSSNADYKLDFLSNGFKLRGNSGDINGSHSYIYMAFAENPFVTSSGVPATAR